MTAKNLRIVLAAVVSIYGVVSAADHAPGVHLPVAISAVLAAAAPIMLAVEHYLSDPSTGTPPYLQSPPQPPVAQPGPQPTPAARR